MSELQKPSYSSGEEESIAAWGTLTYRILKHTSWLPRRVEHWSYIGDATWTRVFSHDIDINTLRLYYIKYFLGRLAPQNVKELKSDEIVNGIPAEYYFDEEPGLDGGSVFVPPDFFAHTYYDLPIIEIDKRRHFSNFDARDINGSSVHLSMRGIGIQTTMNALIGAIIVEHGPSSPEEHLEPLKSTDFLSKFLFDWFNAENPPCDEAGNPIDPNTQEGLEKTREIALAGLKKKAEKDNWSNKELNAAEERFSLYFEKSPIFRYFVRTFTFKRLICVRICLGEEAHSIIKCKYDVTRDLFDREKASLIRRGDRWAGIRFEMVLDGVGIGEVDHTTINAPEGTYFIPTKPPTDQKRDKDAKLYILDELPYDPQFGGSSDQYKPEASASATITPGRITLKTKKSWKMDREGEERPTRRLPVDGCREHRYILNLTLAPKLGLRALGYVTFLFFSAVAFLMCCLDPGSYLHDSSFSLGSLLVIAPMIIMVVANKDDATFIRKQIFRFPLFLVNICVGVDVLGFLWFFIAGLTASYKLPEFVNGPIRFIRNWDPLLLFIVSLAGFLITVICAVIMTLWCIKHYKRKRDWTIQPDAYDLFPLPYFSLRRLAIEPSEQSALTEVQQKLENKGSSICGNSAKRQNQPSITPHPDIDEERTANA